MGREWNKRDFSLSIFCTSFTLFFCPVLFTFFNGTVQCIAIFFFNADNCRNGKSIVTASVVKSNEEGGVTES